MKKKLINLLFEEAVTVLHPKNEEDEKPKSAVCDGDEPKDEDKILDENPICKGISTMSKMNNCFDFAEFVKQVINEHGWYDEEKGYETMADMKFADAQDMRDFESRTLPPDASEEQIFHAELEDDWYLGKADAEMGNIDQMLYRDNDAYRRGADGIGLDD